MPITIRNVFVAMVAALAMLAVSAHADEPKRALIAKTPAPSLAGNLLDDPTEQPIAVYLPPSYHQGDKRYPVVYHLAGFGESYDYAFAVKQTLDDAIAQGKSAELIFVSVSGVNAFAGSFYVNSPVTGGWEDFIVKDLVGYVDATFRTVADRDHRMIAGFSMGGFGAIHLGLRHPDLYATVYAQAPGLLAADGLKDALPLWDSQILDAYAAAFAPDPSPPSPHGRILTEADLGTGNAVETAWKSGFGDLEAKIAAHRALGQPLDGIRIDVGEYDSYPWIAAGSAAFERLGKAAGLPVELQTKPVGHSFSADLVADSLLPLLNAHLKP